VIMAEGGTATIVLCGRLAEARCERGDDLCPTEPPAWFARFAITSFAM
jgi:hypothetical protein